MHLLEELFLCHLMHTQKFAGKKEINLTGLEDTRFKTQLPVMCKRSKSNEEKTYSGTMKTYSGRKVRSSPRSKRKLKVQLSYLS